MTNQNALKPLTPHAHGHSPAPAEPACCGSSACGSASAPIDTADVAKGALLFRIPTMDCAVEQSEIRRALEPVGGISGLRFRLGERTMAITADDAALPEALAAIRKAGFKPEPLNDGAGAQPGAGGAARTAGLMTPELLRLVAALLLAIAASGHWPIRKAPVTATAISALMFSRPRTSAAKPFL